MRVYAINLDGAFARVKRALAEHRLLLLTDKTLPSLVTIVAGEPVAGSWWAHRLGREIFAVSQRLRDDPDAAMLKLVNGKTTFVHRFLWPALQAVGSAQAPWQMDGLTPAARGLLDDLQSLGCARADRLSPNRPRREVGQDVRRLESRLLVFATEVHTESGAHLKQLETWAHWADRVGLDASVRPTLDAATAEFDDICARLAHRYGSLASAPWSGGLPKTDPPR